MLATPINSNAETATAVGDFQEDIDAVGRSTQIPAILETVLLATGMRFVAIARVTESRWITCRALDRLSFGLEPGVELEVESTLCHEVRLSNAEIVIDDVRSDPIYCRHHTPARYGFRSYISVPIRRADGSFFGTLCAIDPEPRHLADERVLSMFRLFAKLIGDGLDSDEKLRLSEVAVDHERHLAGVQERFIAILAHDLRNPVSVLEAGFGMIERRGVTPEVGGIVALMRGSVRRMAGLIENLLVQARTRLGDGIIVEPEFTDGLESVLDQLVSELNAVSPGQPIVTDVDLPSKVRCDTPRIAQLLSNLLGNAITHGETGESIMLRSNVVDGTLTISVASRGDAIPADRMRMLFRPFEQGGDHPGRAGLGLGLYIASEIAKGHGGTLDVTSDDEWTVFTFSMPNAV